MRTVEDRHFPYAWVLEEMRQAGAFEGEVLVIRAAVHVPGIRYSDRASLKEVQTETGSSY